MNASYGSYFWINSGYTVMTDPTYDRNLKCAFESVHLEFSKHIDTARSKLSQESLDEYYDGVEFFATIGQGDSVSIAFANVMPWVGAHFGKNSIQNNHWFFL